MTVLRILAGLLALGAVLMILRASVEPDRARIGAERAHEARSGGVTEAQRLNMRDP